MVQINPGDLPDLPVEQLAQFLLGCAREDPTLLARSNTGPVVRRDAEIRVPLGKPIDLTATQDDAPVDEVATPVDPPAPLADIIPPGPVELPGRRIEAAARPAEPWAMRDDVQPWPADTPPKPLRQIEAAVPPAGPEAMPPQADMPAKPIDAPFQRIDLAPGALWANRGDAPARRTGVPGPIEPGARRTDAAALPAEPWRKWRDAPTWPAGIPTRPVDAGARELPGKPIDATVRSGVPLTRPAPRVPVPTELPSGPIDAAAEPIELTATPIEALGRPYPRPGDASSALVDGLPGPVDATARLVAQKLQLRRSDARDDPELEELVSIAVACARRAEDAVQQAREISWTARRRMSIVAGVTGAGVLAAAAVAVIDRYQAFGEPGLAGTALLTAPFTTAAAPEPGSLGSAARPEPPSAPAALPVGAATGAATLMAEHAPVPNAVRAAADVSPPAGPSHAPSQVAAAAPPPVVSATPVPAPLAAAAPPPHTPKPAQLAAEAPPPVGPAVPVTAAAASPGAPKSEPAQVVGALRAPASPVGPAPAAAAAVSPPVNPAPVAVAAAASPPAPARVAEVAPAAEPEPTHPGSVAASLEAPQATPQAAHPVPVRHVRRVARRVIYYPRGPGLLLAQVVYGVRRNLYDIFH